VEVVLPLIQGRDFIETDARKEGAEENIENKEKQTQRDHAQRRDAS
jgi:hypothetical protein